MKKQYVAPQIEIERYDLSASLAFCQINLGPTLPSHPSSCSSGGEGIGGWATEDGTYFYEGMTNICTLPSHDVQTDFPNTFTS